MTSDTSPRPISPLRARMIEDMTLRGFSEQTRSHYVRHVRSFAASIGRSPVKAAAGQIPIDGRALTALPRVRSSEAFGRRPLASGRSLSPARRLLRADYGHSPDRQRSGWSAHSGRSFLPSPRDSTSTALLAHALAIARRPSS
jgi:hypothetical protein